MSNVAVCLNCMEILHSKHPRDWVTCGCSNGTYIDGGDDYHRGGAKDINKIRRFKSLSEARRFVYVKQEGFKKGKGNDDSI